MLNFILMLISAFKIKLKMRKYVFGQTINSALLSVETKQRIAIFFLLKHRHCTLRGDCVF